MDDLERAHDLLRRIQQSMDDGTDQIPDVAQAIYDEIDELCGPVITDEMVTIARSVLMPAVVHHSATSAELAPSYEATRRALLAALR